MEVALGKYGLQATPAAKGISFKIIVVCVCGGQHCSRYKAMQDSHCRENYNKGGGAESK